MGHRKFIPVFALFCGLLCICFGCESDSAGPASAGSSTGPADSGSDAGGSLAARTVEVGIAGSGSEGIRYLLEGQAHVGEESLKAAVGKLVAAADQQGRDVKVRVTVMKDSGLNDEAVMTASRICLAAGAVEVNYKRTEEPSPKESSK